MINALINYCYDIDFEDEFRYRLIDERALMRQQNSTTGHNFGGVMSTTQDVSIYYLQDTHTGLIIRIIDTPGFGDCEGADKDEHILLQIKALFNGQRVPAHKSPFKKEIIPPKVAPLKYLDWVCITVKSSTNKL